MLGPRTKTSGCKRGELPDRRCSPGAYYSKLTEAVICSPRFSTSTIRDVPQSEKFVVERENEYRAALRRQAANRHPNLQPRKNFLMDC